MTPCDQAMGSPSYETPDCCWNFARCGRRRDRFANRRRRNRGRAIRAGSIRPSRCNGGQRRAVERNRERHRRPSDRKAGPLQVLRPIVRPAVSDLREFATLLDNPLGPLPQASAGQFRHEWMISGYLGSAVVKWDFEPHWERLAGGQDENNRERNPLPFDDLEVRMQSAFCAYERFAFWTEYSALGMDGFDRNNHEPYQRWNSRDALLPGAIAEVTATPGLNRFNGRWDSCGGPTPWDRQRFRIRDLGETTNR